ncbi:hypothetical protein BY457_11612 [Marinilabilia salmonicolor]|jgi:hypothetical protein|nr:hypothetical protein BY457_11612 [Marinilabilia salmonicolor]
MDRHYLVRVYKVGKICKKPCAWSESANCKACDRVPPKALAVAQAAKNGVYMGK